MSGSHGHSPRSAAGDPDWSDRMIGMGFHPEEVALPADWSWRRVLAAAPPRQDAMTATRKDTA